MKARSRRLSIRRRTLLLGAVAVVGIFVFITRFSSTFRIVELRIDDLRMNAHLIPKPSGSAVIVAIDDASIATYGRWPWPRQRIAQLVSVLNDDGVKAIGLDLVLSEADDSDESTRPAGDSVSKGDLALANAIAKQRMVFLGTAFDVENDKEKINNDSAASSASSNQITMSFPIVRQHGEKIPNIVVAGGYLPPLPAIASAARGGGFINILHDEDQTIRSALLVLRFHGHYYAPLSLALVSAFHNAPLTLDLDEEGVRGISVGSVEVPVDESGHMLINFRGPGTFPRYSAADVIAGRTPRSALTGRIVLLGADALGLGDVISTPRGDLLHGVEVHATLIDQLLARDFVRRSRLAAGEELISTVFLSLTAIIMVAYLSAARASIGGLLILSAYVAYAQYRLIVDHVLIGVGIPILAVVLIYTLLASYRYFREGSERQHLRSLFEHYLHPDVIAQMADDPDGIKLGGERRHLAILFADIVNFTSRAERTAPEALVEMLDVYMTDMTDAIICPESRGVVDKLMGDGIMAFWGAPLELPNPARSAIDCALTMLRRLDRLRAQDPRFADLNIGIGIHAGDAIVGNFGGARRFDYSIIGDAVNFASRLEALTRHFGVRLLVSRQAYVEAQGEYLAREVGKVKVKGKSEAVEILEISNSTESDADFFRRYSAVIAGLNAGSANGEVIALESLLQERPGDQVTKLWIAKLKAQAGITGADLVFEFETK